MKLTKAKFTEAVEEIGRRMFNEVLKGKKSVSEIYDEVYKKYVETT